MFGYQNFDLLSIPANALTALATTPTQPIHTGLPKATDALAVVATKAGISVSRFD